MKVGIKFSKKTITETTPPILNTQRSHFVEQCYVCPNEGNGFNFKLLKLFLEIRDIIIYSINNLHPKV